MALACTSRVPAGRDVFIDDDGHDDGGEVSDETIGLAVAQIRRITRHANLEFALKVGAVIIHHFYDGDTSSWRRRGAKTASFRRLAEHPDLPLSAGSLYRCVALFELCERLNAPSRWQHLGASHLRVVLGLPPEAQERVLVAANEKRWTVKALQSAIDHEKMARSARGGRRREPIISKRLRTLKRCLEASVEVCCHLESSSKDEIAENFQLLQETLTYLDDFSQSLSSALRRCSELRRNDAVG